MRLKNVPELPKEEHCLQLLPAREIHWQGLAFRYWEMGAGPPVLLLHGLWSTPLTFRNLVGLLAERRRVIVPALLDEAGRHVLPDLDYRPEALAEFTRGLLTVFGLRDATLVMHAELGLAGLLLARDGADGVRAVVALSPTLNTTVLDRFVGFWLGRARGRRWAEAAFQQPGKAALTVHARGGGAADVSLQELRPLVRAMATLPGATARARILAQTQKAAYRRPLLTALADGRSAAIPLTLVFGQLNGKERERVERLIPGARLAVPDEPATTVHVEQPQWTAALID